MTTKIFYILLPTLIISLGIFSITPYVLMYQDGINPFSNQQDERLFKLSKLTLLPDETPIIQALDNVEELRNEEEFFKDAQDGDILFTYASASKAYIYSPTKNLIVNAGPETLENRLMWKFDFSHQDAGLVNILTCPTKYPENYYDDQLRQEEYDSWKYNYLNNHPYSSSIVDQHTARYKYWVEQGCKDQITNMLGSEYEVYDDLLYKPYEFKDYPTVQQPNLPPWDKVQIELDKENSESENYRYWKYHIGYFAGKFKVFFIKHTLFTGDFIFEDHFSKKVYTTTADTSSELYHKVDSRLFVVKSYSFEDPDKPNKYVGEFYNYFLFDIIKGFEHLGTYKRERGEFGKIEDLDIDSFVTVDE